jgi:hypothetical protein
LALFALEFFIFLSQGLFDLSPLFSVFDEEN